MGGTGMNTTKVDYRDNEGIQRRVLLPSDDGLNPDEGIPISLPVDSLFSDMPLTFRVKLVDAFYAVGLVEASDFLVSGAAQRIQAALLSVVKHDVMDILALAKEVGKHGK